MSRNISVKHPTRQYIIEQLSQHDERRFTELRPPRVDTNSVAYHLGVLVDAGIVDQLEETYALGAAGVPYARELHARGSEAAPLRPGVEIWFVVQNSDGDILIQQRTEQPFIGTWSLPYGAVESSDVSLEAAASRIARKLFANSPQATHAGDCYVRVGAEGAPAVATLVHAFRFNSDNLVLAEGLRWARPHKVGYEKLTPGVEDVMARTFFLDPFFFEEFRAKWRD